MHVLRTFDTPTDVYISGDYYEDQGVKSAFGITDDESGCDISNGYTEVGINTYGYVYIFSADEFRAAIPSISELKHADDYDRKHWNWDGVYLKNFMGEIKLKLEATEDCPERDIKKGQCVLKPDFDPTDYAWYQQSQKATLVETSSGGYKTVSSIIDTELKVILPLGTEMSKSMNTLELVDILKQNDNSKEA